MIKRRLRLFNNNQRGFTLIELLIAVVIAGLVAGGVGMVMFQVVTGNARTSNQMTAVRQVQEAGYWISQDFQMSENRTLGVSNGFPITLNWQCDECDDTSSFQVDYTLQSGELYRSYTVNGTAESEGIIARHVDDTNTSVNTTGGQYILRITATLGSGSQQGSETRVYEIDPRPGW